MEKDKKENVSPEVPQTIDEVKIAKKILLTSEQLASRRRAHALKVAQFLSGGEF